uniref:Retrotransposon protein, putative, Ty3-gypsy subclass n=2 Tax=Oryza sativa subsp. japonica TaxID=39947 RepID=Q94GJ6_ORYSJ|nr:putative polyprotein [Oryza sativa Japonica Group]ABF97108.1 retrotransposon protein, putative, Ty3-gypsy subclass [Oryza sativa Japonica Group]
MAGQTAEEPSVRPPPLGTVSTEELDGYLSSPGVDSRPTEILDYDDFGYNYDLRNLDDSDEAYEDNYAPLFFGVFMADNEIAEQRQPREVEEQRTRQEAERRRLEEERQAQERDRLQHVEGTAVFRTPQQNAVAAITLLDTLLQEDVHNHVLSIINQTKTMIATSVPVNSASVCTPTGSRVPPLRSQDYHQPSLSVAASGSNRRSRGHVERSVHSPADRHRERHAEQPRSPRRRQPVDLRETLNRHRAERGYVPLDRYNDDEVTGIEWIGRLVSSRLESRNYIRRFSKQRNKISGITNDVIIAAFTKGVRHELLVGKFGRKPPRTVKQMFKKANDYAKADDAVNAYKQSSGNWKSKKDTPAAGGSGSNNHKDRKRKPEDLVALTSPSSRQRSRVNTSDKIMNAQCSHHPNSNHAAKDCFIYKQFAKQYANQAMKATAGDQGTSKKKDDEDDAYESKRKQKLPDREINAVQPDTPQYLRWSETAIKFDHLDHPDRVVHPGRYPLVLDPLVRNVKLRRSHIDGGSALNILFAKTLDDMQIPRTELKPSIAPFHGVIPGLSSTPLGHITLPVTFGTRENFRTKNICFKVADFEMAYDAILGRPALAKFMAVPHYTYMMIKMPGPQGVISLRSDIKQGITCDKESCEMAQTHEIALARDEIWLAASTATEGEVPATKLSKAGEGDAKTKKIPLDLSDPSKTAVIGAELDCK